MDFVVITDFESPYVIGTGIPHKPTKIKRALFKKGDIISGDIKNGNDGKPSFVLHKGMMPIPIDVLKKLEVKEIDSNNVDEKTSGADGSDSKKEDKKIEIKKVVNKSTYIDGIVIGGALGLITTILLEKKTTWIGESSEKNKIVGSLIGIAIGSYLVYKIKSK